MITIRTIANDFIESFNQTNPEKLINFPQVVYWAAAIADQLRSQHIQKRNSKAYVHIFPEVPIEIETVAGKDSVPGRKFVTLPAIIYNFNDDKGIDYISYGHDSDVCGRPGFTYGSFTRTTPGESKRLYMKQMEVPSVENPHYMPLGDKKVYLLGLESSDVNSVEMGLFLTIDPIESIDIDAELELPDDLKYVIIRQLYDLGRFVFMIPEDNKNDGVQDVPKDISTQKLVSVNDLPNGG